MALSFSLALTRAGGACRSIYFRKSRNSTRGHWVTNPTDALDALSRQCFMLSVRELPCLNILAQTAGSKHGSHLYSKYLKRVPEVARAVSHSFRLRDYTAK